MFPSFRAAVRPLVVAAFLFSASAGPVLADGNYGGTDPPRPPPGGGGLMVPIQEAVSDFPSFCAELLALVTQWVDPLD